MENNSCMIIPDFLEAGENAEIFNHTIQLKEHFQQTKIFDAGGGHIVDEKWRHSSSIQNPQYFIDHYNLLAEKIKEQHTVIVEKLGLPPFKQGKIEMHLTSHNHSEYFKPHIDNGLDKLKDRVISFVYYFHSTPRQFTGGQLLFLNNKPKPLIVEPNNNSIVFFDSSLVHAVHPVNCTTAQFEHGRFTLNGWIRK